MKMNKKSHTLLNLAIAASLFAFAACSDYLEDFQDKYDDGKAFAEISSDSSDGELSSSSKGNGDAESSDSTDSSSSATDPGSSSSVAESSSAFEPCKGTIIYDYKNPGKLGLNLQFLQNASTTKLPENGQGIELSSNTEQDYAIFALSENDLHDVSSWEGLCVEYSSNEDITLYLADLLKNMEQINLPANDHFKEISWADTTSRKISIKSGGRGRVSFNKFDLFSFGISTTQKVTISRITTIAKVDPGSSSSVAESSSSIAFDDGPCTGDIVFDENSDSNFSTNFIPNKSNIAYRNEFTIPEGEISSYLYTLSSTYAYDSTFDITSWKGLCVEYEASEDVYLSINTASYGNLRNGVPSKATLPKTNGEIKMKTWMWNDFSPNGPAIASNTAILQVSPSTNSNKSAVHIHRITTAKKTSSNPQKALLTEAQFARVDLLNWQLHDRTWPDLSGSTARDACGITDNDILKAKDSTLYSYEDAKEYCNKLPKTNGTWRLPKKTEWENLLSTFDNWGNDATKTYHFLFGDEPIDNYGYCVSNISKDRKLGFWTAEGGFAEFSPQQQNSDYSEMNYIEGYNQSGFANVRCVQDAK